MGVVVATLMVGGGSLMTSCVEQSAKYQALAAQLDSLQGDFGEQKGELDAVFAILNDVENGLSSIRESENILLVETQKEGGNITATQKERVQANMAAIQNAIEQYKAKIEQLKKESNLRSIEFKKRLNAMEAELSQKSETINRLSQQLLEKENVIREKTKQIANLDKVVENLNKDLTSLNEESSRMEEVIATQDKQIYAAYYIIGTKEELVKVGVLTKGGLFRSAKISYKAEKNAFVKIDYREISTINTSASKIKVLSNHPNGTYAVENINGEAVVTISNPQAFWEQTKYLVIRVL